MSLTRLRAAVRKQVRVFARWLLHKTAPSPPILPPITSDAARRAWTPEIAREALNKTYFEKFSGTGSDSIIQIGGRK